MQGGENGVRKRAESRGCEDRHWIGDRAREGLGVKAESLCLQVCLQVRAFALWSHLTCCLTIALSV